MAAEARTLARVTAEVHDGTSRTGVVHLDGLVVLKIIKHCRESLPTYVAGSLLGLDVGNTLEVTNCFPFPAAAGAAEAESDSLGLDYQVTMMNALRDVNVDNNQVGWYQSTYLGGNYCTKENIATQFDFQENIGPNAVMVVYDPLRTSHGSISLKAFRLTDKFMTFYKAQKFLLPNSVLGAPLASSGIFQEVRIRIHNPHMVRAMLFELREKKVATEYDFERLDLSTNPFLEKKLHFLIEQVEDLASWQSSAHFWQRKLDQQMQQQQQWLAKRRAENQERKETGMELLPETDPSNPVFKPLTEAMAVDRLDALLITAQIGSFCQEINNFAGQSFSKLFLAGKLNEATRTSA